MGQKNYPKYEGNMTRTGPATVPTMSRTAAEHVADLSQTFPDMPKHVPTHVRGMSRTCSRHVTIHTMISYYCNVKLS